MFFDLNIPAPKSDFDASLQRIAERLVQSGYQGLAVTTEIDESVFDKNNKEKKKKISGNSEANIVPLPPDLSKLKAKFPKLQFFNRINIIVTDSSNIRKFIQSKYLKKYDLISFQPENQNVLRTLTGIQEVDILSYNPQNKCDLSFNRKLYNQFVNQDVYFELTYAPAIADSTARRNLLSVSHLYKAVGKSKNIIVTSGAHGSAYVRGPYDVINFNLLFGLSEEQSKGSITRNCKKLLLRARKQRRSKSAIEMTKVQEPDASMVVSAENQNQKPQIS